MRGQAFTAAGVAESGVVSKVDKDGRPQDDGVSLPDVVGSVSTGVALGGVDISATKEMELAGGGISRGLVAVVVPGRALPPGKKEGDMLHGPVRERGRKRETLHCAVGPRTLKRHGYGASAGNFRDKSCVHR